jgi:1-acyl-sn-glycerol-3-phosphate acyltransferase
MLDEFKDGAFRLAIEHQIPVVPITFADNKKRFSYTFFSGSPSVMRVKIHHLVQTQVKQAEHKKDIREIREETRDIIQKQLLEFA